MEFYLGSNVLVTRYSDVKRELKCNFHPYGAYFKFGKIEISIF